jgi:hypothetical protein
MRSINERFCALGLAALFIASLTAAGCAAAAAGAGAAGGYVAAKDMQDGKLIDSAKK